MFYIFSIIKQLIFFIIIFISFHFTFNYFRNLFLNKKGIITPNEKYEEIYQILHPSCPFTTNIKSIPKDISTNNSLSLTNNEIQTLENETNNKTINKENDIVFSFSDTKEITEKTTEVIETSIISSIDY